MNILKAVRRGYDFIDKKRPWKHGVYIDRRLKNGSINDRKNLSQAIREGRKRLTWMDKLIRWICNDKKRA